MSRIDAAEAERDAFKRTLEPLFMMDRRSPDIVEWTVYFEALRQLPQALLVAAVGRMARTPRRFPFRPGDILEAAEACRLEISAANPFVPCVACRERRPGWIVVIDPNDVKREARCDCWTKHQQQLANAGYVAKPVVLALPAPQEVES